MKIDVMPPLQQLNVHQLNGSKWWLVLYDHTFELIINGTLCTIRVPAGYRYDRATIWWEGIITKDNLGCQGPLIHDILCRFHGKLPQTMSWDQPAMTPSFIFTRPQADDIFYLVMRADRVSKMKAWVARQAVRVGKNWDA